MVSVHFCCFFDSRLNSLMSRTKDFCAPPTEHTTKMIEEPASARPPDGRASLSPSPSSPTSPPKKDAPTGLFSSPLARMDSLRAASPTPDNTEESMDYAAGSQPSGPMQRPTSPASMVISDDYIAANAFDITQDITARNTIADWSLSLQCHNDGSPEYAQVRKEIA